MIQYITDTTFEREVGPKGLVLVDFSAEWCGPCRVMKPILEKIVQEYQRNKKPLKVFMIDVDGNKETVKKFKVFSIPTLILFINGKEVDRVSGLPAQHEIEAMIEKHAERTS